VRAAESWPGRTSLDDVRDRHVLLEVGASSGEHYQSFFDL
jgi:hypothetical protein